MKLKPAIDALVTLEGQVAKAAKEEDAKLEPRVYRWRPEDLPELPAIWNWIDPDEYDVIDVMHGEDQLLIAVTLAVEPRVLAEQEDQLVDLFDVFTAIVDPALNRKTPPGEATRTEPLEGTVRKARRTTTRQHYEDFNGIPVMCLTSLIRLDLTSPLAG